MRRTIYGAWTDNDELTETEKSFAYVVESAEILGIPVNETTPLDFIFIANVFRLYREKLGLEKERCNNKILKEYYEELDKENPNDNL